ncbi:putative MFS family arabinose efflux permease [Pseudonocardia hierapolitana]|uniref:Putative MFS family arabinose efflux permease n=1 Tax=Pseudonocardia hierapolitana TaxID=1128676 RepID=A0A561T3Q1_9PSEU|nr:MFS transporter [Pseudonocardia hierapolitana]TWF81741.1 putative MFS family arabinose efflux permease [Pseudonocardia hierapolitana]
MTRTTGWPAVIVVATGIFTVVTAEMLPVGLLTPIAAALAVSEGVAGQTLTITGVVAAVSAPLVVPALGRLDRRTALVALMGLLALANLLAAWSPTFAVMIVARVVVGIAMGGVWSVAAGLAVRLVQAGSVGRATATIFSGIAVASVLGVPAGTFLGAIAGWRAAFVVVATVSAAVALAMAVLLPRLPAERAAGLSGITALLRNPRVVTGLVVVALLVIGHFGAYTYVRPVLEARAIDAPLIGTLLLVYGVAGVAGNFVSGTAAARSVRRTVLVLAGLLVAAVLLLALAPSAPLAAVALVVWGLGYGGVSVTAQTWMTVAAPDARETASSLFAGVFNGAIALGAVGGGLVVDGFGPTAVLAWGAVLVLGAPAAMALGRPVR